MAIPSDPTSIIGIPRDGQVFLYWNPPNSDGGFPISDYIIQQSSNNGATWTVASEESGIQTSSLVIGLVNGTGYIFRVAAVNADGQSPYSRVSVPIIPRTIPSAPVDLVAQASSGQARLTWSPPTSNGGSNITGYIVQYSANNGATWIGGPIIASNTSSIIVGNLINGTSYIFRIAASNSAGTGPYSNQTDSVIPANPPSAPRNLSAIGLNASVSLSWQAPINSGGVDILGYRVYYRVLNSEIEQTVDINNVTSYVLTGLSNGLTYSIRIAAINIAGAGVSTTPISATPFLPGTPAAPTNVTAVRVGYRDLRISWIAPVSNGTRPITNYSLQLSNDNGLTWFDVTKPVSTQTSFTTNIVSLIQPSFIWRARVAAINIDGLGQFSQASSQATMDWVPEPPTNLTATAGDRSATLSWTAGPNNGQPIIGYRIFAALNGSLAFSTLVDNTNSSATTFTVNNLSNGTRYVFRVAAINSLGVSDRSASSNSVTPIAPLTPQAPINLTATSLSSSVRLNWSLPAGDGTQRPATTDYRIEYSSNNGTTWTVFNDGVSTSRTATVTGLNNGTTYLFRVAAINSIGVGAYSQTVQSVPTSFPNAPTSVIATAGAGEVSLTWTPPFNNGSIITDYIIQYSSNNGVSWITFNDGTGANSSATVTPLVNGRSYIFRVAAVNSVGIGPYSLNSNPAIPNITVGAPTNLVAIPGNGLVNLTWAAPTVSSGSAIIDYNIQYSSNNGTSWITAQDTVSATTSATIQPLNNGTSYIFRVRAQNNLGFGPYSNNSASVIPRTVPGVPRNLSAVAESGAIRLSWIPPLDNGGSPVTRYRIHISLDNGATWFIIRRCGDTTCWESDAGNSLREDPTGTSYTITNLTNGTQYWFRIAAFNIAGRGDFTTRIGPIVPSQILALDYRNYNKSNLNIEPESDVGNRQNGYFYNWGLLRCVTENVDWNDINATTNDANDPTMPVI